MRKFTVEKIIVAHGARVIIFAKTMMTNVRTVAGNGDLVFRKIFLAVLAELVILI